MPPKTEARVMGLRFTMPGATAEPYVIPGVPGLWFADTPIPVGGDGEITTQEAKRLSDDPGTPLELVAVTDPDGARKVLADALQASAHGVKAAVTDIKETGGTPIETDRVVDEAAATSKEPV